MQKPRGEKMISLEVKGEEALFLYILVLHCLEQFRVEYNL